MPASSIASSLSTVLVKSVILFAASPGLVVALNVTTAQETTSLHSLPPATSRPTAAPSSSSLRATLSTAVSLVSTQGGASRSPYVFPTSTSQPSRYLEESSTAATTTPGESSSSQPSLTSLSSATTVTITSNQPHLHNVYTSSAMTTTTEKTISFKTFVIVISICVVVNVILLVFVIIVVVWKKRTSSDRSTDVPKKYANSAEDDISMERHYPSARFTNRPVERTNADQGADIDVCVDMENGDLDSEPAEVYDDSDQPAPRPGYSSYSLPNHTSTSAGGAKGRATAFTNHTADKGTSSSKSAPGIENTGRGGDRSGRPDLAAGQHHTLTDHQQGDEDAPLEAYENWESKFQ